MIPHILFSIAAIIAFIFLIKLFMRTAIMCQFCGYNDCKVWSRVPEELQKSILDYFQTHEKREPDTSGIFVCDQCKTVFDDFSGEKANREVDAVAGAA